MCKKKYANYFVNLNYAILNLLIWTLNNLSVSFMTEKKLYIYIVR